MKKCITCGTDNLIGSQYCDECGTDLRISAENTEVSEVNESHQAFFDNPIFQSASVTSVGIPLIVEEPKFVELLPQNSEGKQPENRPVQAKLVIERGTSVGTEFYISAEGSQIGRWDADNGVFPDIDLDSHDQEAKVSRRHARIINQNGNFLVEDLGSTNGTFINRGRRLIPGTPQPLVDGDEIIVGKTFLRFRIK